MRLLRNLLAIVLATANVVSMTPIWLLKALLRKRTTKESPNALQVYLSFTTKVVLWWLAKLEAQPALNTRTPSKLRDRLLMRKFTWIEPAPVSSSKRGTESIKGSFDTSPLPVNLKDSETKRKTAAYWYYNPKERSPCGSARTRRKSPVLLYFREYRAFLFRCDITGDEVLTSDWLPDGGAYITLEAGDVFMGLTLARMLAKHAETDVLCAYQDWPCPKRK